MRGYQDQTLKQQHLQQIHLSGPDAGQQQAKTDEPTRQRRTYYAYAGDDEAVAHIREKYGLSTDSDAVRLALRLVAASDALQVRLAPTATRRLVIKLKAPTR